MKHMHFGENSRMALETVRDHKTRSFLTVLGVVIGVAAMIFVASILVGVSRDVQAYLEDYGTNTLFIFRFDMGIHTGRMSAEERARKPLTREDADAIMAECSARAGGNPGRNAAHRFPTPGHATGGALRQSRNHESRLQRNHGRLAGCLQRARHSGPLLHRI